VGADRRRRAFLEIERMDDTIKPSSKPDIIVSKATGQTRGWEIECCFGNICGDIIQPCRLE
jgi:hypothetical protein